MFNSNVAKYCLVKKSVQCVAVRVTLQHCIPLGSPSMCCGRKTNCSNQHTVKSDTEIYHPYSCRRTLQTPVLSVPLSAHLIIFRKPPAVKPFLLIYIKPEVAMNSPLVVMIFFRILDFDVNAKIQLSIGRVFIEPHQIIENMFGSRR